MSDNNSRKHWPNEIAWYEQIIQALNRLIRSTTALVLSIIALFIILIWGYGRCNEVVDPEPTPVFSNNVDIEKLYSYLSCIDNGLMDMEASTNDESLKIAIENFRQYKEAAIDIAAFQKYEEPKEDLSKLESEKLRAYIATIKKDLQTNGEKFSIQLPDCK